jgi:hypothetical protein
MTFFTHQQAKLGDRHLYASRSRFIPDSILGSFATRNWRDQTDDPIHHVPSGSEAGHVMWNAAWHHRDVGVKLHIGREARKLHIGREASMARNDFVSKIVKDPKNPPNAVMLTGFVGTSSEKGHTRVYFDANLSSYVEIPNDAILHTQEVGAESSLGGTYVWVKRDAELIYGSAATARPKGKFLEGPIVQRHLQGALGAPGAAAAFPRSLACPTGPWGCPGTVQLNCLPTRIGCYTAPIVCHHPGTLVCPPTLAFACHSLQYVCQLNTLVGCVNTGQVDCNTLLPRCVASGAACPSLGCPPGSLACFSNDCPPSFHGGCGGFGGGGVDPV